MNKAIKHILAEAKGFLFDLDGVFYIGNDLIAGGAETIEHIRLRGYPCRFVTNNSTRSTATLHKRLSRLGLPIGSDEAITSARAAVLHLRKIGRPVCYLCVNDDVRGDFAEFPQSETNPEIVVIGDIGDRWNYDILNRVFRMLIDGAELVAMHKGRYWQEPEGLQLDIGVFVAGLEYVTGKTATVIGKPNPAFFQMPVEDMGLKPSEVVMIGDDILSDVGGAQKAGLKSILVRTGKYREELVKTASITPDAILDSVADLRRLIK